MSDHAINGDLQAAIGSWERGIHRYSPFMANEHP